MKKPKEFIVQRSKWLRAGRNPRGQKAASMLLNKGGDMCCLGFLCRKMGIKEEEILNIGTPSDLAYLKDIKLPRFLVKKCNEDDFFDDAIQINDIIDINDNNRMHYNSKEREEDLKKCFKKMGIKVKFKD